MRFIIVKAGCEFCREWLSVINRINMRLPTDKRIEIVDNYRFENFGMRENPLAELFDDELFDSYPILYFDGTIIKGAVREFIKSMFYSVLKGEFIAK